ncbi:MAG: hypothetical protein RL318_1329 [Fibrobacterota bacterium]|jgi:hypothetical protein
MDLPALEARLPASLLVAHQAALAEWQARRDVALHRYGSFLDGDLGAGYATGQDRLAGVYGTAGVRWSVPLWGPSQRLAQEATRLQRDSLELEIREGFARETALRQLRHLYVDAWNARRQSDVSLKFLATRPGADSLLRLRTDKKLILDADRREFLTAFTAAQRDTAWQNATLRQTRTVLGLLLGDSANLPDGSIAPRLPRPALAGEPSTAKDAQIPPAPNVSSLDKLDIVAGVDLHGDKWQDRSPGSDAR